MCEFVDYDAGSSHLGGGVCIDYRDPQEWHRRQPEQDAHSPKPHWNNSHDATALFRMRLTVNLIPSTDRCRFNLGARDRRKDAPHGEVGVSSVTAV